MTIIDTEILRTNSGTRRYPRRVMQMQAPHAAGTVEGGFIPAAAIPIAMAAAKVIDKVKPFGRLNNALEKNFNDRQKTHMAYKIAHGATKALASLGLGENHPLQHANAWTNSINSTQQTFVAPKGSADRYNIAPGFVVKPQAVRRLRRNRKIPGEQKQTRVKAIDIDARIMRRAPKL